MTVSIALQRSQHAPSPRVVLELLKPVTWFPPMWAFTCGAVSSGIAINAHWSAFATGIALTGPIVCASSQAVNDWFDRGVDAINEPHRPIPSGRVPGRWGLGIAVAWSMLAMLVGATLGSRGIIAASVAVLLSWAYSAPPVRLKRNGWWGNAAVGISYEGLAWVAGAALMLAPAWPSWRIVALAVMYSAGAHGIMTLNDFKSIEGDRISGIRSLPVLLGAKGAGICACVVMLVPQLVVVALLAAWGHPVYGAMIAGMIALQLPLMRKMLERPRELAAWYNGTGVTLYVLGMLVSAFALRAGATA